ncbi:MAG: hypothetical protein QGH25_18100, partial [Candidatus Latescibacteria bacterium]|nr:hypothetical protein [Candidatus Latescibacterota bacterium]
MRRYGAAEAEHIGATADLRALIDTGLDAARDIYRTYWPRASAADTPSRLPQYEATDGLPNRGNSIRKAYAKLAIFQNSKCWGPKHSGILHGLLEAWAGYKCLEDFF